MFNSIRRRLQLDNERIVSTRKHFIPKPLEDDYHVAPGYDALWEAPNDVAIVGGIGAAAKPQADDPMSGVIRACRDFREGGVGCFSGYSHLGKTSFGASFEPINHSHLKKDSLGPNVVEELKGFVPVL